MNEKHIARIKELLTEWNPLGEESILIEDLNNYETEATDILFHSKKRHSLIQINKLISTVINQAFGLNVNETESESIAEEISKMLK